MRGEEEYDDQGEENKGILSGKEQNKDERKGKRRGKMRKSYRQRKGSLCDDQDEIDKEVERGRERMNKMERNKRPKDLRIPKKTTASTAYLSRKPETGRERKTQVKELKAINLISLSLSISLSLHLEGKSLLSSSLCSLLPLLSLREYVAKKLGGLSMIKTSCSLILERETTVEL